MTEDSANAVFEQAQTAIGAGDLATAFGFFDRGDLLKIAGNSMRALAAGDPEFDDVCARGGFDPESLRLMRDLTERMAASAALMSENPGAFDSAAHRQMAKDYDAAIKNGFRTVTDLAGFAAALEERMRTVVGGGSISRSLFGDEALTRFVIDGKKAWATRVHGETEIDDIGFVQKRDGWKIRLFAKRPDR